MEFFKRQTQGALKRAGLYHRLKTSSVNELYRLIADKNWIRTRDRHLEFYRRLLPELLPGDLIFDVGANDGLETDLFLRLGARVIAVDPDESNQSILRERFVKFRLSPKPVVIVGKAVSDKNGMESFWVDGPGSAVNTLSQKWATTLKENKARHTFGHCGLDFEHNREVETTTLEELIKMFGRPIYIKIDVEGYELNVLRGLRQLIPYISFEVNLPEFRPEGLECISLLNELAPNGRFNYTVECTRGIELEGWQKAAEFLQTLERCEESAIEVFFRNSEGRA